MPASWGLKGKSRDIAEAEYYYEGEGLARKLAEIEAINEDDLKQQLLEIDLEYKHIDRRKYDTETAKLNLEGDELALEMARINHEAGDLSDAEYDKEVKTINKESYISVINIDGKDNSFEFDWNLYFIEELEEAGYGPAPKEEMIVEQWFNALCKEVTLEAFQGDGSIDDLEEQEKERKGNLVKVTNIGEGRKEIK
jgi:hypothetical protein